MRSSSRTARGSSWLPLARTRRQTSPGSSSARRMGRLRMVAYRSTPGKEVWGRSLLVPTRGSTAMMAVFQHLDPTHHTTSRLREARGRIVWTSHVGIRVCHRRRRGVHTVRGVHHTTAGLTSSQRDAVCAAGSGEEEHAVEPAGKSSECSEETHCVPELIKVSTLGICHSNVYPWKWETDTPMIPAQRIRIQLCGRSNLPLIAAW